MIINFDIWVEFILLVLIFLELKELNGRVKKLEKTNKEVEDWR